MNQTLIAGRSVDLEAGAGAAGDAGNAVPERIHADHVSIKRLGHWTSAERYEVRARSGSVLLDLRSPRLPGEVEIRMRLDHAVVKLLLPDGATVEHWGLAWTGSGKVKEGQGAAMRTADAREPGGAVPAGEGVRRVRLVGAAEGSEIRVNRGGVAILAAMWSREYVRDVRQARKSNAYPTVDDPTRAPKTAAA